jgi:precorrin-6Y C5,15-methyltransferase (decarboxylating)
MSVSEPWLWVVGIGEDGWEGLSGAARLAVRGAAMMYGGARHVALVPEDATVARRVAWPSPMAPAVAEILAEHRGKTKVAVLASGDPMLYGVGVPLTRDLGAHEFRVLPQVSSFSLACARMGWAMAETKLVSVVSRPVEQVLRLVAPAQGLVVFSEDGRTPAEVARLLVEAGYGTSEFRVWESLGGAAERSAGSVANAWGEERCGKLNLIAIRCVAEGVVRPLSLVPGLPDDAFESDGQMTKREVRAVTLARLAPLPGQTLWDVGAGSGTVGIEWMRVDATCACVALERREDRAERIRLNAARLGVPGLRVVVGSAPETFAGQPQPDAIFMGGAVADDALFAACWERLASGGRMVANAVTIGSEVKLAERQARYGGELTRMSVARADGVGSSLAWRTMMPVTQWWVVKP